MIIRRLRPTVALVRNAAPRHAVRRTLIAPPKADSGPLLERRSDRELPSINPPNPLLRTFPIFLAILAASTAGLFNYQKMSSPVVSSNLYALRMSAEARELLGDEIYFASKVPWIWGTINQLHGNIDIRFSVKGTKGRGEVRFRSTRKKRMGFFVTEEWSLRLDNDTVVDLLDKSEGDPFRNEDDVPESRAGKFI